eukprot:m.141609 g.141609  ORF g.141609 m.141609 type:complete len:475 (-) comp17122_c0_seq2:102-1526(-)
MNGLAYTSMHESDHRTAFNTRGEHQCSHHVRSCCTRKIRTGRGDVTRMPARVVLFALPVLQNKPANTMTRSMVSSQRIWLNQASRRRTFQALTALLVLLAPDGERHGADALPGVGSGGSDMVAFMHVAKAGGTTLSRAIQHLADGANNGQEARMCPGSGHSSRFYLGSGVAGELEHGPPATGIREWEKSCPGNRSPYCVPRALWNACRFVTVHELLPWFGGLAERAGACYVSYGADVMLSSTCTRRLHVYGIIRHPHAQRLSLFRDEIHYQTNLGNIPRMNFSSWIRSPSYTKYTNYQLNWFSGYAGSSSAGWPGRPYLFSGEHGNGLGSSTERPPGGCTSSSVIKRMGCAAWMAAHRVEFTAVFEELALSVCVLCSRGGMLPKPVDLRNVSKVRHSRAQQAVSPADAAVLNKRDRWELRFYDIVARLFWTRARRACADMPMTCSVDGQACTSVCKARLAKRNSSSSASSGDEG